jgi:hypothetical protein
VHLEYSLFFLNLINYPPVNELVLGTIIQNHGAATTGAANSGCFMHLHDNSEQVTSGFALTLLQYHILAQWKADH